VSFLRAELESLEAQHLRRSLRSHSECPGREIEIDGTRALNFSSNNYLGLAGHKALADGARESLKVGTSSTASRLVTGNLELHERLEERLAVFHGLEAVRLFGSGYQANLGLISCLANADDLVVSDKLNHASIIDGIRLSKATCRIAEHCSLPSVRQLLAKSKGFRRRFVVTDSVFSMDGDSPDLRGLRALCDEFDAFLVVDEAHASGCLGLGKGLCAELGVVPDALVGGLGKAFGSYGGYVGGSRDLAEVLLNRARSFVFSTALPPAVLGASLAAVDVVASSEGESLRAVLLSRMAQLRDGLAKCGKLESGAGCSPIFPFLIGQPEDAMRVCEGLLAQGIHCQAIRPPTVEVGTSRLRIALSALHTKDDVDQLLQALAGQ
jgi:8-amino-7-oxononanoate synthase